MIGIAGSDDIVSLDFLSVLQDDSLGIVPLDENLLHGSVEEEFSTHPGELPGNLLHQFKGTAFDHAGIVLADSGTDVEEGMDVVVRLHETGDDFPEFLVVEGADIFFDGDMLVVEEGVGCRKHPESEEREFEWIHVIQRLFAGNGDGMVCLDGGDEIPDVPSVFREEEKHLLLKLLQIAVEGEDSTIVEHVFGDIFRLEGLGAIVKKADVLPERIELACRIGSDDPVGTSVDVLPLSHPTGAFSSGNGVLLIDFDIKAIVQAVYTCGQAGHTGTDDDDFLLG